MDCADGEWLRKQGNEFGSTTGRPRRCGWIDLAALRYAAQINGFDALAVTKLDVLTGLERIKVCLGYRDASGNHLDVPPSNHEELGSLEPDYVELDGWSDDLTSIRSIEELPVPARKLLSKIEKVLDIPVEMVSVGPGREETIVVSGALV